MNSNKFNYTEDTTLEEWLNFWFYTYKIGNIKDSTRDDYMTDINCHILTYMGSYKLSEISSDILQTMFNELYESGNIKTGNGLSPKSVLNIKNILFSAFQKAVSLDYITKNPCIDVEIKRAVKPDIIVLTNEEEQILKNGLISENFSGKYDMAIYLSLKLGLRNGEVSSLKWKDFDLNERVLHVRRRVKRVKNINKIGNAPSTILQVGTPKTKESNRDIPFTQEFLNIIQEYMMKNSYRGKSGVSHTRSEYIFISDTGDVADPATVNKYFQKRLKHFGINNDNLHFHCLRHTFATRAIEKNVDIKTLSAILGHSSVQFTLDRYAHVLADQKRKTMETLLNE